MLVSREKLIETRTHLLKEMTAYIEGLGKDDKLENWETFVIALGAEDAEYIAVASDEVFWENACNWFSKLVETK